MCKIRINDEVLFAEKGELLSDVLIRNGKSISHPCGGKGTCRKCKVLVDGRKELSCQYRVTGDVSVSFLLFYSNSITPKHSGLWKEKGSVVTGLQDR